MAATTAKTATAPLRDVNLGALGVTIDRWPDGRMVVRSKERLLPYPDKLTPSIDASELTDKGSLNQRAVLQRRAALVDDLYAATASPLVVGL
jgi:hypothetical protein